MDKSFMTINIGIWTIPTIITIALLCVMFRPYHRSGQYDFGEIFRAVWLIPIAAIWVLYMALLLALR